MAPEIVTIAQKKDEKFLRKKTVPFDFKKFTRKEVNDLITRMQRAMHAANGIGLSANQIGLEFSVFVAEVPDAQGGTKFYAVFNPKIEKASKDAIAFEEGCLSVPGQVGRGDARGRDRRERLQQDGQKSESESVGTALARLPARDRPLERQALH